MARQERLRNADQRAMEIQRNVETPYDGRAYLDSGDYFTHGLSGGSATPSMGVSQFRGGGAVPSSGLSQHRGGARLSKEAFLKRMAEGRAKKRGKGHVIGAGKDHSMDDSFWEFLNSLTAPKIKKAITILNRQEKSYDPDDYYTIRISKGASKEDMLSAMSGADPRKDAMEAVRSAIPAPKPKKESKAKKVKVEGAGYDSSSSSSDEEMEGGSMRRVVARGRADVRALEEEDERVNPIDELHGGADYIDDEWTLAHLRGGGRPGHAMGERLAEHLSSTHGGAYVRDFYEGMGYFQKMPPVEPPKQAERSLGEKIKNEFVNPDSKLRSQIIPEGAKIAQIAEVPLNIAFPEFPGIGTAISKGAQAVNIANQGVSGAQRAYAKGQKGDTTGAVREMLNTAKDTIPNVISYRAQYPRKDIPMGIPVYDVKPKPSARVQKAEAEFIKKMYEIGRRRGKGDGKSKPKSEASVPYLEGQRAEKTLEELYEEPMSAEREDAINKAMAREQSKKAEEMSKLRARQAEHYEKERAKGKSDAEITKELVEAGMDVKNPLEFFKPMFAPRAKGKMRGCGKAQSKVKNTRGDKAHAEVKETLKKRAEKFKAEAKNDDSDEGSVPTLDANAVMRSFDEHNRKHGKGKMRGKTTVIEGGISGKKRRAPAGAGDGRKKRAEIVRKVMKEHGLSMIEASKKVKADGLY